jgi:hypothetical protein
VTGYRTGDAARNLQIGVGVDAADTASFDGLSNYWFDGNLLLTGTDSDALKLGAGTDMSIYYDGTNGNIDTDLVAASDLVIDCGTDKTVVLEETVWNDFVVPVQVASRSTVPGTTAPNELAYRGGLVYEFPDGVDRTCYFVIQLPHTYKEGTDIVFHLHWTIDTTGAGAGAENVEWDYSYSASSPGQSPEEQWPAETTGTATVDVQSDNQHDHLIDNIVTISGANFKISEVIIMSLTRTGSTDSYGGHALLVSADVHHEIDTVGSRQIAIK